jgi:hypothetical protein
MLLIIMMAVAAQTSDIVDDGHWSFAGVPRITINADEGFGLGLRGQALWHRFGTKPYKTAITAQAWITTKLVQHHFVRVDAIDAFNLPLRWDAEAGFFASKSFTYCADNAACPDDVVHRLQSIEPYLQSNLRLRVATVQTTRTTHKVDAFVGLRGTYYQPGTLFDDDGDGSPDLHPIADSDYALRFPRGEPGLAVLPQLGVAYDGRDDEIVPTRGAFIDVSVRGASSLWQSALQTPWNFVGSTASVRLFSPLLRSGLVVLAQRAVIDVTVGDAPVREQMRIGGLSDVVGLGGLDLARGVRLARFVAPLRISHQVEVRVDLLHIDVWGHDLGWLLAGFVDAGVVTDGNQVTPMWGAGISNRIVWDRNFAMRLDIALSPSEPRRWSLYSAPGQVF